MLNAPSFDEIAARIGKAIENSPAKDIEKNVKAMLSSGLARLDLVPRAEFDLQSEVLRKTREKLEALEKRVAEVEARFPPSGNKAVSSVGPVDLVRRGPRANYADRGAAPLPGATTRAENRTRLRPCPLLSSFRADSPGATRRSSPSRCISPVGCLHSISSVFPTRRSVN